MGKFDIYGLLSLRLPEKQANDLVEDENKKEIITEDLHKHDALLCPLCRNEWPKKMKSKKNIGVRINLEDQEKLKKYWSASTAVAAYHLMSKGICPLCFQSLDAQKSSDKK